jgi:hypothetical protein
MLKPCPNCKENSVVVKTYIIFTPYPRTEPLKKSRVEFCINKGCGYCLQLPYPNLNSDPSTQGACNEKPNPKQLEFEFARAFTQSG